MGTILVVDDEENIRFLLRSALIHAGYRVLEARNGRAGVDLALAEKPSLIVLDVMMPGMDGFAVLQRLRELRFEAPILFLTARNSVPDELRGLAGGADDYITKPFSLESLLARIAVQLRRSDLASRSATYTYDDLELDDDRHLVRRSGALIELSATEYNLLRYLLTNSERVVSKAQILDHVWHYDFGGESNIVESYISMIRRKIDDGHTPLIKTVRGVGYALRRDER